MPGEIEAYLNARLAFETVKTEIEIIADEIMRIGALIKKDPARFAFSGTDKSMPEGSFVGQNYPASDWKTAHELQDLLFNYQASKIELRSAWALVPTNLRSGLQPPPAGVLPPRRYDRNEDS